MAKAARLSGFLVSLLLAIVMPLFAPNVAAQQTDGAIDVGETQVADADIERRIRDVIGEIGGYDNVTVSVRSGVVRLGGEVLDGAAAEDLTEIAGRVDGVVAIDDQLRLSADVGARLDPVVRRLETRFDSFLVNLPVFLIALLLFGLVLAFGLWLAGRAWLWHRLAPNPFIATIYQAVARLVALLLALVAALEVLNATALLGAVLGAAGVAGLALGFAVRDTVENFVASIMLSLRQPFGPDDFVEIAGDIGNVSRLTSRATILISPDGNHIRIPNATVFKSRIVNFTRAPDRRFTFELGVDAEADHADALAVAAAAIERLDYVLGDPAVSAWISEVGDSNVILSFAGWLDQTRTDFLKGRGEAIRCAKDALEASGFGLPEPIYRVRLSGADGVAGLTVSQAPAPERPSPRMPAGQRETPVQTAAADPARRDTAAETVAAEDRADARSEPNLLAGNSAME